MSDAPEMLDIVMSRRGCSPVLVGRAAEMAALEAALEAVRQGEPAAVLVGGEAGMGKTRLIGEFTATARGAGVRVLTGACLELGADGLPYSPFTAMLRDLVRRRLRELSGETAGGLGQVLLDVRVGLQAHLHQALDVLLGPRAAC